LFFAFSDALWSRSRPISDVLRQFLRSYADNLPHKTKTSHIA
jgi:hypothetical protein